MWPHHILEDGIRNIKHYILTYERRPGSVLQLIVPIIQSTWCNYVKMPWKKTDDHKTQQPHTPCQFMMSLSVIYTMDSIESNDHLSSHLVIHTACWCIPMTPAHKWAIYDNQPAQINECFLYYRDCRRLDYVTALDNNIVTLSIIWNNKTPPQLTYCHHCVINTDLLMSVFCSRYHKYYNIAVTFTSDTSRGCLILTWVSK